MGTTITYESALDAIDKAIESKGEDFRYVNPDEAPDDFVCRYFDSEGNPSCIVGHVYAAHGYGPDDIQEGATPSSLSNSLVEYDAFHVPHALRAAQYAQDHGKTWADARIEFIRKMS